MAPTRQYRGIPIKDRTEADIRAALAEQQPETTQAFVDLHAYARANKLGLTALAHQSHIPNSILSQCFNGSYDKGDYDAIGERIRDFFWRMEQKALYGGLREFKETQLCQGLWALFEKTRIIRRIQIIQGPEQVGKTRSAAEYSARNNSGRTVFVSLSGGTRHGSGDFIWTLAESMGIPYTAKLREKKLRIRQGLEACDLVIIDEAHLCFDWTPASQREFWNYVRTDIFANGARGVVFLATNADMLTGLQHWRRRVGYNVGQLLGRMRNEVMEIDPVEDITPEDVALLVSRYYKPGKRALAKLHDLATREQQGHFGLLDDIMNESWTRAKSEGRSLDDATVLDTARHILSQQSNHKDLYK